MEEERNEMKRWRVVEEEEKGVTKFFFSVA